MDILAPSSASPHVTDSTSDNTTVKTESPAVGARAMLISVKSKGIYLTLDGSTPSSTNGLYFPPETMPVYLPIVPKPSVKWISVDAAGSTVDILWLT